MSIKSNPEEGNFLGADVHRDEDITVRRDDVRVILGKPGNGERRWKPEGEYNVIGEALRVERTRVQRADCMTLLIMKSSIDYFD